MNRPSDASFLSCWAPLSPSEAAAMLAAALEWSAANAEGCIANASALAIELIEQPVARSVLGSVASLALSCLKAVGSALELAGEAQATGRTCVHSPACESNNAVR